MFHYYNVKFEDCILATPEDIQRFNQGKPEMESNGFIKGDLPYFEDGDVKLVESFAIGKYVGRKLKCFAENEKDLQVQEQIESLLNAFLERIISLRWGPEGEALEIEKKTFIQTIEKKLKPVENLIGKNGGDWICGTKLTWVDFLLAWAFSLAKELNSEMESKLSGLQVHLDTLRQNDGFKKYYDPIDFNLPPLKWEVPRAKLFGDLQPMFL